MKIEKVSFQNSKNQRIAGKIFRSSAASSEGVIFCHGLFSTKDGYKITQLAPDIVSSGFTLLAFDFSFVGESGGKISELSIFQELDDLSCAVRFFTEYGITRFHLIGSSFGGAVSALYASQGKSSILSLVLIATPIQLRKLFRKTFGIENIDSLPEDGMTPLDGVMIQNSFYKEIITVDSGQIMSAIHTPTLILHGAKDLVVPVDNAISLDKNLPGEKKLVILDNGDHNLSDDKSLGIIRKETLDWINAFSK